MLQAAEELAKEGISAEVLNLRTLKPLDRDSILNSVKKTHRLVTVEEGWPQSGVGAEIIATVSRRTRVLGGLLFSPGSESPPVCSPAPSFILLLPWSWVGERVGIRLPGRAPRAGHWSRDPDALRERRWTHLPVPHAVLAAHLCLLPCCPPVATAGAGSAAADPGCRPRCQARDRQEVNQEGGG